MRIRWDLLIMTSACLMSAGCESYRAQPLNPGDTVLSVERSRRLIDEATAAAGSDAKPEAVPFTFARAAELMRTHGPSLQETAAEYDTAIAAARVKTPLPNPALEVGPRYGFGADVLTHRFQPFGSLGFAIPTGQRLKRQDELNLISAEMARIEFLAKHRELYMQLRRAYSRLVLSQRRLTTRQSIYDSSQKSLELTKRLQAGGQATAMDTVLFELDAARLQSSLLDAKTDVAAASTDIAQLIGVHMDILSPLPEQSLPELPPVPASEALRQALIENHPDLARLRARYEVAERQLHLEIAKQYPDFRIGPTAEGDVGDRKTTLGLTLGIDLPIFDRNQQAIAGATAKREEIRKKYETTANRALAELDRAFLAYNLAGEKLKLITTVVAPKAQAGIDLARKSLDAGAIDMLRFLETERAQRGIQIDAVDTELAVRGAFTDLEQAVGCPLTLFPSEVDQTVPCNPNTTIESLEQNSTDSEHEIQKENE